MKVCVSGRSQGGGGEMQDKNEIDISNISRWTEDDHKKFSEMFDRAWENYEEDKRKKLNVNENSENDDIEAAKIM